MDILNGIETKNTSFSKKDQTEQNDQIRQLINKNINFYF